MPLDIIGEQMFIRGKKQFGKHTPRTAIAKYNKNILQDSSFKVLELLELCRVNDCLRDPLVIP